jgi:hypothetical protein
MMAQSTSSRTLKPDPMVKWTKVLALATIGLTVGTAALVATGVVAILAANDQSVIAAKAEIDASTQNKLTEISQFNSREQLRAVIGLASINGFSSVNLSNEPGFTNVATFQNYGGTRTGHFKAWSHIKYFDKEVPNNLDLSKPYSTLELGDTIVGPGAPSPIAIFISKGEVDKVVAKQGVLVMWGLATYNDIFDVETEHVVSFCYNVNISLVGVNYAFNGSPLKPECNYSK